MQQATIWSEGSPGESIFENLKLVLFLAKSFNLNRREIRVPEYRSRYKKILIPPNGDVGP